MSSATPPAAASRYHHGDLANVLRGAAAELLTERGVAGFSLREVARRAGVSHAAPAHHFGDAPGLLTAVAIEGFAHLQAECEAAVAGIDDPVEALARLGRAYVTVSVEHPGHCAVMFREDAVRADDPAFRGSGRAAYGVLVTAVERLAEARAPDLDVPLAAALCWSSVQGLVATDVVLRHLAEDDGQTVPPIGDLADQFTRLLIDGLVGRRDA